MAEIDLKPTRIENAIKLLQLFILEFFDQNPLSQLGIIVTREGLAEKISDLTGNPVDLKEILARKDLRNSNGEPSLQNAIELALNSLWYLKILAKRASHVPSHGSREIIGLVSSLTSCDPGDINETLARLKKDKVRVSMVGLSAEVRICRLLCEETQGNYGVLLDDGHFKELLFQNVSPPALAVSQKRSSLIQMGFPIRRVISPFELCTWYFS